MYGKSTMKVQHTDGVADVLRKKTRKETDTVNLVSCFENCNSCASYKVHVKKRNESRQIKKTATSDKSTVFFSADLQKVVLLLRLPGYKKCIFTSRLITFNMTFAPIGVQGKCNSSKAQGILWHEAICGRRDEDIASAYFKMFSSPLYRDYKNWVIWVDNCG